MWSRAGRGRSNPFMEHGLFENVYIFAPCTCVRLEGFFTKMLIVVVSEDIGFNFAFSVCLTVLIPPQGSHTICVIW